MMRGPSETPRSPLGPAPRTISADKSRNCFDSTARPVATINSGEIVTFECGDKAYENLFLSGSLPEDGTLSFNMVTGPVAVVDAKKSDSLAIEVLNIEISRAWVVGLPGLGPLGDFFSDSIIYQAPIANGRLKLSNNLSVDIRPTIGCIGLAPENGRSSTLAPAYPWGGNLDLKELCIGATILLPVQKEGALLSVGDLHAAMGAGEPSVAAIEASGKVTLGISLLKDRPISYPRLLLDETTVCVVPAGRNQGYGAARESAVKEAFLVLVQDFGLTPTEAYAYVSAKVDLRLGGPACPIVLSVIPHP